MEKKIVIEKIQIIEGKEKENVTVLNIPQIDCGSRKAIEVNEVSSVSGTIWNRVVLFISVRYLSSLLFLSILQNLLLSRCLRLLRL